VGVILKIFIETQPPLRKQPKHLKDRILLALGINPTNQFTVIDWEGFKKFKGILVNKDSSLEDMVEFATKV
jgi:hypothetical protein